MELFDLILASSRSPSTYILFWTSQGMQNEALNEYVAVIFADRKNGNNPSTIEKADEVCRSVAAKQTAVRLESIRAFAATNSAPLPTKSYCRKFFEALPSVHQWREQYRTTDRAELSNCWNSIVGSRGADKKQEDASPSTFIDLLTTALDLSRLDISNSLFVRAFGTINTALNLILVEKGVIVEDVKISAMLSILWQLKGVENLFRRDDTGCLAALQKSLKYDPNNLEANLVLCILHLELVQIKEVQYSTIRGFVSFKPQINRKLMAMNEIMNEISRRPHIICLHPYALSLSFSFFSLPFVARLRM